MTIKYQKNFQKHLEQRVFPYKNLKAKFEQRLQAFLKNPHNPNPLLRDHPLTGSLKTFRSFSVTGDIRVIYRIEHDTIRFYDVGSHNQVY